MIIEGDRTEVMPDRLSGLLDVASDNIDVPTLLVRGQLSDIVTQAGVDEVVKRIKDITVVEVEGAAHMIAGDRNDSFTSAVVEFLNNRVRPNIRGIDN
jgi:pimeloyl-ACP methyl ester carboxylesterase